MLLPQFSPPTLPPPPTSHSPPARCLGNQEQMFHFGLAMAALSQPSNALWPLASPQLSQRGGGARPSPSSLHCLQPPAMGTLRGAPRKGQGLSRPFIFHQAFTRAKDQSSPIVICISGDERYFYVIVFNYVPVKITVSILGFVWDCFCCSAR